MCALIPSISLAQMESEHYEVNSYSYGESAHVKMSSESFSFQDVGDVADPKSKTTGSRLKRIPQGTVFGISSTTETQGTNDGILYSEKGPVIINEDQIGSVRGFFSETESLNAILDIDTNDRIEDEENTPLKSLPERTFVTTPKRLGVLFFVICLLAYFRFYTKTGRKWAPF